MPSREEQFATHAIFADLGALQDALETTRVFADETSLEVADQHRRITHIAAALRRHIDAADPLLAPLPRLENVVNNIVKARQEIENFRSTRSVAHIDQSATHAEAALAQIVYVPTIGTAADAQALQEAAISFRRSLGQHHRHAEEQLTSTATELETLRTQIRSLTTDVQQVKARADDAISRLEAQFSQAESERRREYQGAITQGQQQNAEFEQRLQRAVTDLDQRAQAALNDLAQKTNTASSDMEQRFQASQQTRNDKFEAALDTARRDAKATLSQIATAREEQFAEYDREWQTFQTVMAARQADVDRLVGAVSQTGMVAGYQRVANEERLAMRVWQGVTVASIVAFVALMIWLMPESVTSEGATNLPSLSWPIFIGRALAALGLAGLAAFASRESAKHGEKERLLRQFELEIASIGPFIATIPKEEQDAMKKTIADRAFGRGLQPLLAGDNAATTNGAIELLRMVLKELLNKK